MKLVLSGMQSSRASKVFGPSPRRGVWRQDQLRVVDDVADITVVADEADPTVRPLHPRLSPAIQSLLNLLVQRICKFRRDAVNYQRLSALDRRSRRESKPETYESAP